MNQFRYVVARETLFFFCVAASVLAAMMALAGVCGGVVYVMERSEAPVASEQHQPPEQHQPRAQHQPRFAVIDRSGLLAPGKLGKPPLEAFEMRSDLERALVEARSGAFEAVYVVEADYATSRRIVRRGGSGHAPDERLGRALREAYLGRMLPPSAVELAVSPDKVQSLPLTEGGGAGPEGTRQAEPESARGPRRGGVGHVGSSAFVAFVSLIGALAAGGIFQRKKEHRALEAELSVLSPARKLAGGLVGLAALNGGLVVACAVVNAAIDGEALRGAPGWVMLGEISFAASGLLYLGEATFLTIPGPVARWACLFFAIALVLSGYIVAVSDGELPLSITSLLSNPLTGAGALLALAVLRQGSAADLALGHAVLWPSLAASFFVASRVLRHSAVAHGEAPTLREVWGWLREG